MYVNLLYIILGQEVFGSKAYNLNQITVNSENLTFTTSISIVYLLPYTGYTNCMYWLLMISDISRSRAVTQISGGSVSPLKQALNNSIAKIYTIHVRLARTEMKVSLTDNVTITA